MAEALFSVLRPAGQAALARLGRATVQLKSDGTKVTDADMAAHDLLAEGLRRLFPDDTLRSEEADVLTGSGTSAWYIDPIDGTGAFTEGLAHWGPTICRVVDGRLEVGATWFPRLQELWFARRGGGAWRDDHRLSPPDQAPGDQAILLLPSRAHLVGPWAWPGRTRALGCTAAHLALVASGSAAATVIPAWSLWDVGAGILLVEEAGRRITSLSGERFDPIMGADAPGSSTRHLPILAAAPSALPTVVAMLRTALDRSAARSGPRTSP